MLVPTARIFHDSASASAHLQDLDRLLEACPGYDYEDDGGVWSTAVAPAPALDVPDSVAALGWSQSNQWGRTYEVDIQRGNLVVRLVLNSDGAGPTEQQFRQIAEDYATLLAELEPVP